MVMKNEPEENQQRVLGFSLLQNVGNFLSVEGTLSSLRLPRYDVEIIDIKYDVERIITKDLSP